MSGSDLPIVAADDEAGALEELPRTVLITGAAGTIGRKLRGAWADRYDLIPVDRASDPADPDLVTFDLSVADDAWMDLFDEADAVVHLAANPSESASWGDLIGPNLDAMANVLAASARAGVERVVFASSNHAMGGYRDRPETPITADLSPIPGNPYGATKLMGERLGRSLALATGLTFVALRIGWVQRGANRPETLPDAWSRGLWLSDGDLVRLFTRAVEAELEPGRAVVVNGMSANPGMRWSLAEAAEILGYRPEDGVPV